LEAAGILRKRWRQIKASRRFFCDAKRQSCAARAGNLPRVHAIGTKRLLKVEFGNV
jgi:hypothetical protein